MFLLGHPKRSFCYCASELGGRTNCGTDRATTEIDGRSWLIMRPVRTIACQPMQAILTYRTVQIVRRSQSTAGSGDSRDALCPTRRWTCVLTSGSGRWAIPGWGSTQYRTCSTADRAQRPAYVVLVRWASLLKTHCMGMPTSHVSTISGEANKYQSWRNKSRTFVNKQWGWAVSRPKFADFWINGREVVGINAVFRTLISQFVPEIFAIKFCICATIRWLYSSVASHKIRRQHDW